MLLERHPALQVAFLEANCSWVPWLLWRLDVTQAAEVQAFAVILRKTALRNSFASGSAERHASAAGFDRAQC